jgi:DNA-binding transcriptional LysR family regulator
MITLPQHHMDWNLLRIFYFICHSSTLTEAAKHLQVTQSCLSRRLADLELNLGYRVFNRGRRGVTLLEEGKELLELVSPVFDKFTQYQASRTQQSQTTQGLLKVLIPPHLPVSWLTCHTTQFLEDHPQLSFSLSQQVAFSSRFTQYTDCAIQLFDPTRTDELIQRPLCAISYGLYTSQNYLDRNGSFKEIEDLQHHPKLVLKEPDSDRFLGWPESVACDPKTARIHEFSTAQDLLEATRQGLGIAALPRPQAASYPDLVALPFYMTDQVIKLYYAYPKYYQDLKRVTLYGDFLEQHLNNYAGSMSQHFAPVHHLTLATG